MLFRSKHFVCGRESGFCQHTDMHFADGNDACQEIRSLVRFRLMEHEMCIRDRVMLTFDMEKIKEAGYDLTTPMIITNSDDYQEINILKTGNVTKQDAVLEIKES